MSWVKLDDAFSDHPKVVALSDRAFRLHIAAVCYAARYLTDGAVTNPAFTIEQDKVAELVAAGLWDEVDGGYHIHDYLDYNPSREQVEKARDAAKQRKERWKERRSERRENTPPIPYPYPREEDDKILLPEEQRRNAVPAFGDEVEAFIAHHVEKGYSELQARRAIETAHERDAADVLRYAAAVIKDQGKPARRGCILPTPEEAARIMQADVEAARP